MSDRRIRKVVLHWTRYLPYSYARLSAARTILAEQNIEVIGLETASTDAFYFRFDSTERSQSSCHTLFPGRSIQSITPAEMMQSFDAFLDATAPDLVVIAGYGPEDALACLRWCLRNRIPTVVMSDSSHLEHRRKWWREWLKSAVVRQFHAALVGGKPHQEYIQTLGIPAERIFIGYDVVDNEFFAQRAGTARENRDVTSERLGLPRHYFLGCGRIVERKNFARLVDAFTKYRMKRGATAWDLVLVGDGPEIELLKEKVRTAGIEDHVRFFGFQDYEEIPIYYGLASAFVCPSTSEQWGLVVNEAMACGLPVIVSESCGCAADLVEEGVNGFLVDPLSVDSIATAMDKISEDELRRDEMAAASSRIIHRFTPESFAEALGQAIDAAFKAGEHRPTIIGSLMISLSMSLGRFREPMS